jgi:hypothetical protein
MVCAREPSDVERRARATIRRDRRAIPDAGGCAAERGQGTISCSLSNRQMLPTASSGPRTLRQPAHAPAVILEVLYAGAAFPASAPVA